MEEQNKTNEDQCTPSKIAYFHSKDSAKKVQKSKKF